ncbi:carboxypeptidase M32 [Vibrio sp. Of7-15]|uniref:carboxypeptidase M32 n=1 Tax=Vibrio sp. Of7-15 TaxID=2724879 RepID=UPI001EF1D7E1|nr:carboxypeptidase M32 [Vibrio sp. Of7-15]MCG7500006.1 carboxypeptidase M32 [Vibrio sp. Of7-15]
MESYNKLVKHFHKISRFNHLGAICGWDQAAVMPEGGNQARSEAMAELSVHVHQLQTQPQLGDWFGEAERENLSDTERASLREMKRQWTHAVALPEELVEAQSLAGSKCEHAWRTQRGKNDWHGFSKNFAEVVALSQEEAQIRSELTGLSRYDAMLDLYEPGATTENLDALFSNVKSWLPNLIKEVQEKQASEDVLLPKGQYSAEKQKQLGLETMKLLGFDFNHGRLDVSVHPFCGGVPTDVRITTRYDEDDFIQSLMGTVHETGHARYEQGLPKELAGLPVGEARSMGIHESQSLFFEMQVGRSNEFIQLLAPMAAKAFGEESSPVFETENFTKLYTRVQPGLIRVDADEVTYPAHVILRYEIERDLMNGKISYRDIPELWDQKMQAYLGLSTKSNYKDGCMQDIHWTDGSFGYFPSYTLGAMYAAQFMASASKEMNVANQIQSRNLPPIFNWLDKHVWKKASTLSTEELVTQATGETLNADHFKKHLTDRYLK